MNKVKYITGEDVEELKRSINEMRSFSNIQRDIIVSVINSWWRRKEEVSK